MASKRRKAQADSDIGRLKEVPSMRTSVPWEGPPLISSIWAPKVNTAFKLLLSLRLTAAVWSNISDCDETFNYWEPAHFLIYGKGFQTWEYSPVYAIRSYAYIMLHMLPYNIISLFSQPEKIAVFYLTRVFLALCCSICETYFYRGVLKQFGSSVARLTLAFLLLSTGMYISSTAFLPSSFSMYMLLISMAAWFHSHFPVAIVAVAASTFLGWPFAALLGVPIALDITLRRYKLKLFIIWCLVSVLVILLPVTYIDSVKFGKLVIASLNIIKYNVLTDHGPDLYGTEPFSFYFINGFLNFNFIFPLALISGVVLSLHYITSNISFPGIPHWLTLMPMYLWILVFFTQPHKEERFLFPIYPLICLSAAQSLDSLQRMGSMLFKSKRHYTMFLSPLLVTFVVITGVLSASRILALYHGYHAPLDVYTSIYNDIQTNKSIHTLPANKYVNVCVGKEWYRFTSNFFLPTRWNLKFIESEFRGQLPGEYSREDDSLSRIPAHMNDMNREEPTRYIARSDCHYLIDLDLQTETPREPNYSQLSEWRVVFSYPFLNHQRSHPLFRAFYIPIFSNRYCKYASYNILKRVRKREKRSNDDIPQSPTPQPSKVHILPDEP